VAILARLGFKSRGIRHLDGIVVGVFEGGLFGAKAPSYRKWTRYGKRCRPEIAEQSPAILDYGE